MHLQLTKNMTKLRIMTKLRMTKSKIDLILVKSKKNVQFFVNVYAKVDKTLNCNPCKLIIHTQGMEPLETMPILSSTLDVLGNYLE